MGRTETSEGLPEAQEAELALRSRWASKVWLGGL